MIRSVHAIGLAVGLLSSAAALAVPTPGIVTQFDGVNLRDYIAATNGFATTPPDMAGAVSPTSVIQFTNGGVGIYDKSGNRLSYSTSADFLIAAGIPAAAIQGSPYDPRLTYDPATKRFFGVYENTGPAGPGSAAGTGSTANYPKLGDNANADPVPTPVKLGPNGEGTGPDAPNATPNNPIYILVSNSSNPLDGFKAVQFNTTKGNFGDFPTLGVSHNAVTIATNDFDATSLASVSVFTLPKKDLLAATPTIAHLTRLEGLSAGTLGFAVQAVNNAGSYTGTFGIQSQKLVAISATSYNQVNAADLLFNNNGNILAGVAEGAIPIAYDGDPAGGRQPVDVTQFTAIDPLHRPHPLVDNGDDRIGASVQQVGNYIFGTHTYSQSQFGSPSTNNSVSWFVLDVRTNANIAEGTISDPNLDFAYSSIAASRFGHKFVVAYTGSGPNQILSAYASVCDFTGTSGSCGAPILLKEGVDPGYILTFNGSRNRYGDYSAIQYDRSSGNFWLFQEYPGIPNPLSPFYSPNEGRWNTIITELGTGVVPEPGALGVLGLGLCGIIALRRRARRSRMR